MDGGWSRQPITNRNDCKIVINKNNDIQEENHSESGESSVTFRVRIWGKLSNVFIQQLGRVFEELLDCLEYWKYDILKFASLVSQCLPEINTT